jgi:transposase-like protein
MIKSKDKGFVFSVRLQMVRDALEKGIKATARHYKVSKNTVRKWLRRYLNGGTPRIKEESRAPRRIPHKTPREVEQQIIMHRQSKPYIGAKRLKRDFDIPCSHGVLRDHGMIKHRKRKKKVRNNLREIKDKYRAFERNCLDTKHLYDIPSYWPQMKALALPRYQYTFRDMKLGAMFLGYSKELSLVHSTLFVEGIGAWLKEHGVKTEGTIWQSDGGSECIGSWQKKGKSAFIVAIEALGAQHFQVPKITYNADVETVHNTIEFEFWFIRKRVEKMKITFKNKCNIPLFVIPTCSESFFKDMIYKERFPTSGNDASINGYTFNIINQSLSTKIRMKVSFLI